jgi:sugar phosphate isomerase/epimerase
MRQLGIDCLSIFGMPPVPFIELTAELGCSFVSLGLPVRYNPENYPAYSLKDPIVQRETKAALNDHGISLIVGEGFFVLPNQDVSKYVAELDVMAGLGARIVNTLSLDSDRARSFDQFGRFAELAAERGLASSVEFVPGLLVGNLADGIDAVRHVGRPDFKLVIDTMHVGRSGCSAADLKSADSSLFGYVQICDCMIETRNAAWEQGYERMSPGDGELPLKDFLNALPGNLPIGIEIPQRSLSDAGRGPRERLAPCVAAARSLLAKLEDN